MLFADSRMTMAINLVLWIADAVKYVSLSAGNEVAPTERSPLMFVLYEFWTVLAAFGASMMVEMFFESEVRASLAAKNDGAAFQSMLSALCDSVVKLNGKLHIEGSSPKLAHMISSSADLNGISFMDLLASETERERFKAYIDKSCDLHWERSATPAPTTAHSASLKRSDSSLRVRFFHSCRVDFDGELSHLLCVCQELLDQAASSESFGQLVAARQETGSAGSSELSAAALRSLVELTRRSAPGVVPCSGSYRSSHSSASAPPEGLAKIRSSVLFDGMPPSADKTDCNDAWAAVLNPISAVRS